MTQYFPAYRAKGFPKLRRRLSRQEFDGGDGDPGALSAVRGMDARDGMQLAIIYQRLALRHMGKILFGIWVRADYPMGCGAESF